MLTNIENRLEELFEQIEMMPPEKVEMAEKVMFRHIQKILWKYYCDVISYLVAHSVESCYVMEAMRPLHKRVSADEHVHA